MTQRPVNLSSKHSSKVRLLLHLSRLECQLAGQIKWANLSKEDRLAAARSAKLLGECMRIIQQSINNSKSQLDLSTDNVSDVV
jgi:hypothetical protein